MGRVLTNATTLAFAYQTSKGVLGGSPVWFTAEPNDITSWGATIATVARSPISKLRQRRKGTITDLDSGLEYEEDLTVDVMAKLGEGFLFAVYTNADLTFRAAPAVPTGYTVPALSASQAGRLLFNTGGPISLLYARGYAVAANNGLKPLTVNPVTTDTTLQVAGNSSETPPTNAQVSIAGVRCTAGDLALAISAGVGTLTSGNNAVAGAAQVDFTTLGLTKGQRIHVGGMTGATQPFSGPAVNTFGSARIRTIAAATLVLDKLDDALVAFDGNDDNAGGTPIVVDLLFGRFGRNVPVDDASFLERYIQFEAGWENLFETDPPTPVAEPDGFEYALDNLSNTLKFTFPLTDKIVCTFGFVGTDTEPPVDNGDRKANASTPIAPLYTEAFNTTSDYARLRIADVDDAGLTTDFKDWTLDLNNNVSPEKVQGLLGAKYLNFGNIEVSIEGTLLFTNPEVIDRIRDNTTVTFDFLVTNDDGAIAVDIPSMTLGNGARELPVNESVRVALTGTAFVDAALGTSVGISLFPAYPGMAA